MMTNDRELLEAAAKAAGMTGMKWTGSSLGMMIDPTRPEETGTVGPNWNPLTDDGDALRLAVKLSMRIYIYGGHGDDCTIVATDEATEKTANAREEHGSDPAAATRRAIVRAAADLAPTHNTTGTPS